MANLYGLGMIVLLAFFYEGIIFGDIRSFTADLYRFHFIQNTIWRA